MTWKGTQINVSLFYNTCVIQVDVHDVSIASDDGSGGALVCEKKESPIFFTLNICLGYNYNVYPLDNDIVPSLTLVKCLSEDFGRNLGQNI